MAKRLSELLDEQHVTTDFSPLSGDELLDAIVDDLDRKGFVTDADTVRHDLREREAVMSTGVGNGVAIPHAYTDGVDRLVAAFYRTARPVDFDALDRRPVDLFFVILGPKQSRREHIKFLAKVSRLLNHEDFRDQLRQAAGDADVLAVLKRFGDR